MSFGVGTIVTFGQRKFFKFKVNKFISKNLIKFFEKVNHKSFNNLI